MPEAKTKQDRRGTHTLYIRLPSGKSMPVWAYCKIFNKNPTSFYKRYYRGKNIDNLFYVPTGYIIPKYGQNCFSASEWIRRLNVDRTKKGWEEVSVSTCLDMLSYFKKKVNDKNKALEILLDYFLQHKEKEHFVSEILELSGHGQHKK